MLPTDEERLDKAAARWREEINAEISDRELAFDIDKYNKVQRWKKFKENSTFIALCVGSMLPIWMTKKWPDLFFNILPFLAITGATVLFMRSNSKIKNIDHGLSLKEFQKEELAVLTRECRMFKKVRWFFFPMMGAFALFNIFGHSYEGQEKYIWPIVSVVTLVAMVRGFKWGLEHYKNEIDSIENQMGMPEVDDAE